MHPLADTTQPTMTVEEFRSWAEGRDGRWELMSGVPVRMQSESRLHSRTSRRIAGLLEGMLDGHVCTLDERVDVVCDEGEVRNPDILIDCAPEAATSTGARAIRPVVVIEIAVTSQAYDLGGKHLICFRNPHVMHYIVVLPLEKRAMHAARDGVLRLLEPGETLALTSGPGMRIAVDDLIG